MVTGAAFPAQKYEAEKGNIVVPPNHVLAGRTMGAGRPEGFFPRNTVDTDVKKTADERAEERNQSGHRRGVHGLCDAKIKKYGRGFTSPAVLKQLFNS